MHDLVIGPFINRYECRRAIAYERHNAAPLAFSGYLPHEELTALGTRMTHISVLDLSLITEGGDAATALSNRKRNRFMCYDPRGGKVLISVGR
jgi:hypothetical protein